MTVLSYVDAASTSTRQTGHVVAHIRVPRTRTGDEADTFYTVNDIAISRATPHEVGVRLRHGRGQPATACKLLL
jgi:hypothetical protein